MTGAAATVEENSAPQLLLVACELAKAVDCRPQRQDGTDAAVYASSASTLARRIRAGAKVEVSHDELPAGSGPARFRWVIVMQAGAARRTVYHLWLDEPPSQLEALLQARAQARTLRAGLPHHQRKRKPWGPL